MEPSEAPAGYREGPAQAPGPSSPGEGLGDNGTPSLLPCCQGQNQLCWLQYGPFLSCQPPVSGPGQSLGGVCCSAEASRAAGSDPGSATWGASLNFSKTGFLTGMTRASVVPSPGPTVRAPKVPGSPLGDVRSGAIGIVICSMSFHPEQSLRGTAATPGLRFPPLSPKGAPGGEGSPALGLELRSEVIRECFQDSSHFKVSAASQGCQGGYTWEELPRFREAAAGGVAGDQRRERRQDFEGSAQTPTPTPTHPWPLTGPQRAVVWKGGPKVGTATLQGA